MALDAIGIYKLARRLQKHGVPVVPSVLRKAVYLLHSSIIPPEAEIGEGTMLGYGGIGVVIHKDSRIGNYCLISHQVTIGGRGGLPGAPVIGNYVRIGAGAKVLGPITIGDYAVIGANAVVVKDVAPGAVVAGIPAREIRRDPNPAESHRRELGKCAPDEISMPESKIGAA